MLPVSILARKLHRWLAYLVFIQLTFWVVGGLVFAVIPFTGVIKGANSVEPPSLPHMSAEQLIIGANYLADNKQMRWVSSYESSLGPVAKLVGDGATHWLDLRTGQIAHPAPKDAITRFAQSLYIGSGTVATTRLITAAEPRFLGLVDEMYGRSNVWQVAFDDAEGTRLYFDSITGTYLTVRNDYWVVYDAMWRLHIMDYSNGENFNNPLLRILTPLAFLFVLSGIVLTALSAKRMLVRQR